MLLGRGTHAEALREWARHSTPWEVYEGSSEDPADEAEWEALLQEAATLPGPGVPNVCYLAPLGTTYSRWQLLNGGARTFRAPLGTGVGAAEAEANREAARLAYLLRRLAAMGKVFALEATAPDARYPKLWDDPEIQGAIAATRAVVVPAQYASRTAAAGDDGKGNFTRRTWMLLSRELMPWGAALCADHESVVSATPSVR